MKRLITLVMFFSAVLVGCSQPPVEPLRIASSPWPGYEPLYLARDLGYLDKLPVRLNELPSSNVTLEAFKNGSADIATLTLDETLTLLADGKKARILAVMDISNGADAVMARPEVKSLADMKGKRVAIVNIPLGVYMLNRTLDAAGLTPSDVTVVTLPEDRHEKAYVQGKVDVAITFEPFKTRLAQAGAHVIFDSSHIPNEIFDLLVVREEVYANRRKELCEFVRQWFVTLDYIRDHPRDAATRMGKRLGMDEPTYRATMGGLILPSRTENQRLLGGATPALLGPAQRLVGIMAKERLISVPVNPADAIDPSFQGCLQ
ncbi:MAG: ABC transporter substrate-binding protein [Sulfuricella sp.]|nr:ABC transporter substrate-binding protein [Sulfuricella sp.]